MLFVTDRMRREMAQSADDVIDIAVRLAVAVPVQDAKALLRHYDTEDNPAPFTPNEIAWDIFRQFGNRGLRLYDLAWQRADESEYVACCEPGGGLDVLGRYRAFKRDRVATDRLLVDLMDDARHEGLALSAAITRELERLESIANTRRDEIEAGYQAKESARINALVSEMEAAEIGHCAESEWDTLKSALFEGEDDFTDEQAARHEAALADWHRKYDHLFSKKKDEAPVTVLHFPASPAPLPDLIKTSAEFVQSFVPPEFLIDGVLQRRYFYSLTAATGVGKTAIAMRWMAHVVAGRPLVDKEVQQGAVLYFAGENPDDVRARWLVLTREIGLDPAHKDAHFIVGAMDLSQVAQRINAEIAAKGLRLAMVVVDTAAAYNFGDDENSNTQAGNYARQLRTLTELPGGQCVVVLCHPTKRAADDDLLPRGGGAFLAEVDGNLAVMKKDSLLAVVAQGKFRGDASFTLRYELEVVRDHPKLRDVRGRNIPSVLAKPVGEANAAAMERRTDRDTETVLRAVSDTPGTSPTDLARALGWTYGPKAAPNNVKVLRILKRLSSEKLVVERLGTWRTTQTGDKVLNQIDLERPATVVTPFPLPSTT